MANIYCYIMKKQVSKSELNFMLLWNLYSYIFVIKYESLNTKESMNLWIIRSHVILYFIFSFWYINILSTLGLHNLESVINI